MPGEECAITTGEANRVAFNFLPGGCEVAGERMSAEGILAAWRQEREARCREEEWSYKNPDHPLSYLMCAWDNYLLIRDYVNNANPKVYMKRGKSVALLSTDAPKAVQEKILGKIGA